MTSRARHWLFGAAIACVTALLFVVVALVVPQPTWRLSSTGSAIR